MRCALYMATLSAVHHAAFSKRFIPACWPPEKKPLVAMTTCMRKLIVLMNHLIKNDKFQLAN